MLGQGKKPRLLFHECLGDALFRVTGDEALVGDIPQPGVELSIECCLSRKSTALDSGYFVMGGWGSLGVGHTVFGGQALMESETGRG